MGIRDEISMEDAFILQDKVNQGKATVDEIVTLDIFKNSFGSFDETFFEVLYELRNADIVKQGFK